jgi:TatD DNase family protein
MLIDIHCHLNHCYFKDDLDKVIDNAKKADVKVILTAGTNHQTNKKVIEISGKYDIVKACLGIYPVQYENNNKKNNQQSNNKIKNNNNSKDNYNNKNNRQYNEKNNNLNIINKKNNTANKDYRIKKRDDNEINNAITFIEKNKKNIIAIGEVGLDYFWVKDNIYEQKELFEKMINLTEKLNKPIIVHSRKAEEDAVNMLQSSKLKKIIMHCFSGKKSLVKKVIDNNWFLTIPTNVTKSFQFQDNVKITPITQLFCETDSPYLSPFKDPKTPKKLQRNEPAFIIEAYKKIAEIKGMELKEVVNNVWMNWQRVF